ncbi:N-acetylmuramoyl-L-alanine amidase [Gammaproteobacteria bacterium AS21]|jgi:N-acetylmuramoyl-L-alanine amidase
MSQYLLKITIFTLLLLFNSSVFAKESVKNVRMWLAPESTRLVFDLSAAVKHTVFTLQNPDRIVIDIEDTGLDFDLSTLALNKSAIKKIRAGNSQPLRIVIDLLEPLQPSSFALKPNNGYGHRLVIDLEKKLSANADTAQNNSQPDTAPVSTPIPEETSSESSTTIANNQSIQTTQVPNGKKLRDIVIALDAGHGGEDPGAIGPSGLKEKIVVLAIAKELEKLIDAENGFISRMIRRNDYYVSLRGRTSVARKKNADLFVSIHADAFKNPKASGASVWVLSNRGASSEVGRWLAQKENSSDLIGGVGNLSLDNKDEVLKGVLLDMSMTASRKDSREVAAKIHGNISKFAKMHKSSVEQAGFLVLKSPDIPSILVETGFISNPGEERSLKTSAYRKKMAKAIFAGIKEHFLNKPPAFTEIYRLKNASAIAHAKHHKVVSGDSLSRIAVRYKVKVASLKALNKLQNDNIRIGQRLQIPTS